MELVFKRDVCVVRFMKYASMILDDLMELEHLCEQPCLL